MPVRQECPHTAKERNTAHLVHAAQGGNIHRLAAHHTGAADAGGVLTRAAANSIGQAARAM